MFPIFSILIKLLAFFLIAQYFIGFIDLLKFRFGIFIIGIKIGMIFPGQLSISLFDLFLSGAFIDLGSYNNR
jgi:hypothetical protein